MSSSRTSKVFALSLGQGLTTLIALVSGMAMTRILSQAELATYRQTMLAYEIALPLLGLGVSQGIYYFLPTEKRRARGLVVDGLVMMLVMGVMYGVFIVLGGNHILAKRFSNLAIVNTLVYLVPLPIVMLPAGLLASVMVVQDKVKKLTIYNVLTSLILTSSVIAGCLLWKTPEAMILVRVGVTVLTGLVAIALIIQALPRDDWRPRLGNMKTMVTFSIPLVLAGAIGTISLQLDKIIVSSMCAPEAFAVYSTGAMEIPVVGMITGSIASVILPDLRRMVAAGDNTGALEIFRKAAEKSAIFIIPIMIFLMVSAKPFILTLFSSKYADSVLPFRLYLLILPMRIVMFGSFLTALGLNKSILYRAAVGLTANAVMSVILVHRIGFIGAILGTIISVCFVEGLWNVLVISRSVQCSWRRVLPFGVLWQLIWVSALACLPVMALIWAGVQMVPFIQLAINGVCFSVAFLGLIWIFRVEIIREEILRIWRQSLIGVRNIRANC